MKVYSKGLTLAELMVVIAIIIILSTIAVFKWQNFYEAYKFQGEASRLEYAIRWAKNLAMERYEYIEVSPSGNYLVIVSCGVDGSNCSNEINRIRFDYSLSGNTIRFSPRGIAHRLGSICISGNGFEKRIVVNRVGIRSEDQC